MIRRVSLPGLFCLLLAIAWPAWPQQGALAPIVTRAEAGDTEAQAELAFRYHEGLGVVQNFATAAHWAARAAQAGDAKAQNLLGRYYHSGLGVEADQKLALRWLGAAADTGDAQYLYDLGQALENGADGSSDPAAAANAYEIAAGAGHEDAAVSLGLLYQEGRGVPQDFARARKLYEQPAESGHARAQNNLGLLYVRGHGVPQDYEKAARLFEAAANQGLALAMRNLGVMYANAFGVPLDEARADALYRQAGQITAGPGLRYDPRLMPPPDDPQAFEALKAMANAGDPVAEFQLAWVLANAPGAPFAASREAARLFRRAADAGHGPAMANLGVLYFEGRGVPQDYVLGRMWLTLAGSAGFADAPALVQQLGAGMTPEQIAESQARAENRIAKRKP